MRNAIRLIGLIIICLIILRCSGMQIPSAEGFVLNACNEESLEGVEVIVTIIAEYPRPVESGTVELKKVTLITDKNGFYKMESIIQKPRGFFLTIRRPFVSPKKDGYSYSRFANSYWKDTFYLIPDAESNYELMQSIWNESNGQITYASNTDRRTAVDNRFHNFMRYSWGYGRAEQFAKTPRELAFLEYFCLRARQTYASFTEADHASMQEEWKYNNEYRKNNKLSRLPINRCIEKPNLVNPPKLVLSESKKDWHFERPYCGKIEDILGPLVTRLSD